MHFHNLNHYSIVDFSLWVMSIGPL